MSYWWYVFIASDKTELKLDSLKEGNLLTYATEKFGGDNADCKYNWIKASNGAAGNQCLSIFQVRFSIFISQAGFLKSWKKKSAVILGLYTFSVATPFEIDCLFHSSLSHSSEY